MYFTWLMVESSSLRVRTDTGIGQLSRSSSSGGFVAILQWPHHGGTRRAASTSNVTPTTTDKTEAMNTAILAASKSASDRNASPAMKSDIVNPIPPSAAARANCAHEYSLGLD